MDFQRRRLAALVPPTSTPTMHIRDDQMQSTTTSTTTAVLSSSTIAKYGTGLSGVNQAGNLLVADLLWWSLGILAICVLIIRITELAWAKLRQVSAMSVTGEKQAFWKSKQWNWMPGLKKGLIYAPLWKKRHNREIRLSSTINMGTLPSRFLAIMLVLYLGSNLTYMMLLDWANGNKYSLSAELRGRSGTLAMVNMVPLIILAGRNNPLISLLQISFDTYNLIHRWMGRVVVIEVILHVTAWVVVQVADDKGEAMLSKMLHSRFIASGTVSTFALLFIFVLSLSPIRHAFYECFLNTHIVLAVVVFVGTWIHCASTSAGALPQLPWIATVVTLWLMERLARVARLAYCNWSHRGYTEAVVVPLPGDACRVTLHLARYIDIKPGTHAYLRFANINPWETHPFSIARVEHRSRNSVRGPLTTDKDNELPISEKPLATSVSFVIGAQTGFTRTLYDTAVRSLASSVQMPAAFEGPYGGHHSLESYGHVVLFAGATGITHQISYLEVLIRGYNAGTAATRRVTLIWIVRNLEALEWVRPFMDAVLRLPNCSDVLGIRLFVTRPKNPHEMVSTSNMIQIYAGRPNVPLLLLNEVHEQVGAMSVSVCGPGGLADDVRSAVRMAQDERQVVDFIEESFTW